MIYRSFSDRMEVDVPEGEVDGLVVQRFEVKDPDDWTEADEKRDDVTSPLEYACMERDGRAPKSGWYTRLLDYHDIQSDGHPRLWMSDTTAERSDHAAPVARIEVTQARRVLVNGLGLGMVVQAALSYDHVMSVDVVEKDERVIKLVGPHYLTDPRVSIIHADAYKQVKKWPRTPRGHGKRWDVAWSDIWSDISPDNIEGMDRLHRYYRHRSGWHGMWARKLCLQMRRQERRIMTEISALPGVGAVTGISALLGVVTGEK